MAIEKRGIIDDQTPSEDPDKGAPPKPGEPATKRAADDLEAHTTTRLAEAVAGSVTRRNDKP